MRQRIRFLAFMLSIVCVWSSQSFAQHENETQYCISDYRDAADIVYLVNYLFRRGPAPEPIPYAANVDFEGGVNLLDVVYLVNFVYRGGPHPCYYCAWHRDPSDTRDAETIAMWRSHELTAPEPLMSRIQSDLEHIRTLPGAGQTPLTSLRFQPRWTLSFVVLDLDTVTARDINSGQYHAWDSLNSLYQLNSYRIDSYLVDFLGYCFGFLSFEGIKNSLLLADSYGKLPGVLAARASFPATIPEYSLTGIYPKENGDTMTYLFRLAWLGCGSGLWNRYWYVAALPDSAWVVGHWESNWPPTSDPPPPDAPAWWPYARENALLWHRD